MTIVRIPNPFPPNPLNVATLSKEIVAEIKERYAPQLEALKATPAEERKHMTVMNDIEWLIFAVESLSQTVIDKTG